MISERGDVLIFDFVRATMGAMLGPGLLMLLFRLPVRLIGVLKELSRALVSGQVIFFSVVLAAGAMGMGRKVTVLGSDLL